MYSAISGLKMHQAMLDVTANDIANVNTIGYKSSRTTFTDQMAQLQGAGTAPGQTTGGKNPAQIGLGVQFGSIDSVMGNGAFQSTGNALDLAVKGEGWFRVTTDGPDDMTSAAGAPANAEAFTRAGNFDQNAEGFLVTKSGAYLLGKENADGTGADIYLKIPKTGTNVTVGTDGQVSYLDSTDNTRKPAGFLTLSRFSNEGGLERASTNLWQVSAASGPEVVSVAGAEGVGDIQSGVTEMSNVDLANEFTELISAQRGFQANSRVISTSDSVLEELVNLKR
ncbi:MAG TPA: flagellar hook-basal body complex protein [Solirubrobacteraceae bacterium]|nr:flagellar hook-basal body complex protein [Solirubrobacteraceae bacterium]